MAHLLCAPLTLKAPPGPQVRQLRREGPPATTTSHQGPPCTYQAQPGTLQGLTHGSRNPLEQVCTQVLKLLPGNLGLEVNVIQQALNLGRSGRKGQSTLSNGASHTPICSSAPMPQNAPTQENTP